MEGEARLPDVLENLCSQFMSKISPSSSCRQRLPRSGDRRGGGPVGFVLGKFLSSFLFSLAVLAFLTTVGKLPQSFSRCGLGCWSSWSSARSAANWPAAPDAPPQTHGAPRGEGAES
jgi:hypothetical protein